MMGKLALERVIMGERGEDKEEQGILCGLGVLQYLGVGETQLENGENPRVIGMLTSILERAIDRNDKELANTRSRAKTNYSTSSKYNISDNNCVKSSVNDGRKRVSDNVKKDEDNAKSNKQKLSMFNGMRAPGIGIESYIMRINKYARCSPCCFVLAYAYISKLISDNSLKSTELVCIPLITSLNIHRLLITSIMLAAKFMDDSHYNNAYFAKIGGVSTTEINGLEMAFLKMIGYRLHVSPNYFERLCSHFVKEVAMQAAVAQPPPFPHIPCPTLHCSFDEEQDRKVARVCTQCSGV